MRFATVEYQGKTFVGVVDKAGEKVTPAKSKFERGVTFSPRQAASHSLWWPTERANVLGGR